MHFHLPKPLHGWREFLGEVGIIVLGVLIALGFEQLVEDWHWNNEVRTFRKAVDFELGRNMGVYEATMRDHACAVRRLADLERLLADSRSGQQPRRAGQVGRPRSYSLYFNVWDNKGADLTSHLPLDVRTGYGGLYDEFHNYAEVIASRGEAWRELQAFGEGEPLDHSDRMRLRTQLNRAENAEALLPANYAYIANLARPLGIRPIADPQNAPGPDNDGLCRPPLAS